MQADFDMNGNQILNLPEPVDPTNPVRLQDIDDYLATAAQVAEDSQAAQDAAAAALAAEASAQSEADIAEQARIFAQQYAADAAMVSGVNVPIYASIASAQAATIHAAIQCIETQFYAPNYAIPSTLVGRRRQVRRSLADITAGGYSARSYFRSTDRYMPDGSTDAVNGGYWLIDEVDVYLDQLGVKGDGTNESSDINGAMAACAALGKPANLRPGKTYRADTAFSVLTSINGRGATLKGKLQVAGNGITIRDLDLIVVGATPVGVTLAGTAGTPYRDITLDKVKITFDAGTTTAYREAVQANYITNLKIRDCNIMYGIALTYCPDYSITGSRIDGEYLNNSELLHASAKSYGIVSGNHFLRSNDNWIDLYSSGERTVISGNKFVGLKSYLGTGIEIKVSLTDDPANTSGDTLGWTEQIIISGNYFGDAVAYSSIFHSYINVYYIDTRASPAFLWANAPRNIIIGGNVFDGWDGTLHGTGYFSAIILNAVCAATVAGNIFRNMTLQATGSEWSSCIWVEDCKDVIIVNNRGAMRYGCGISLHGANTDHSITGNHLLYDEKGGFKSKYGITAPKVGSRADPTLVGCTIAFNKIDATSRALRFPYYVAGGLTECHITGNDCREYSTIDKINRSRITDNSFACTASAALGIGSLNAITAHNTISGNTFKAPSGNTLPGCTVYCMRASGIKNNRAFDATEGLWFIGTNTAGEMSDLSVSDNYSVAQTGASFPRYTSMNASDTASLVVANNRKVTA